MIMNKLVVWLAVCLGGISSALYADTGKPVVWILICLIRAFLDQIKKVR